ncbi:zinc-dependent alcohol dehydrogenase family protein [Nocardia sp. CA2R105]|uniref:zinc-dependent alcohol dehydrogenase family protein n=1 Tax=Nocardia coffeae TaxID=2873381 RepID=UPI001CA601D2|nr:zinc-dependent alcohol dehydrogenase family protein [Nocardia coffeae]MBY8863151.1 zinc-dependent alcohol dehydrogenase family protein [Nocardia coffeae]
MPRVVIFDEPGDPEVLHIVEEPIADPGPNEVRIRIEAFAVNRLDQMARSGASPRPIRLPHARLGIEGTGVIDAIGPQVEGIAVGDAVMIAALPDADVRGSYAEYTVVPATAVVPRPAGASVIDAAALWVSYSTAYGALVEKAGMRPGDSVLITAASSSVGLAAIQIANQIGAVPIAVTSHSAKRDALLAAGAAVVIATEEENVAAAARHHTGGAGVDIILDSVMGPGLAELATAAELGGTLITVGWLDPRPASFPSNALTIHRYMSFEHTLDPVAVRRIAAFLGAGLRFGALKPTVDTVFAVEDIVEAHRHLEKGQQVGKIVVTV